jgi:hypothetical protein
VPHVIVEVPEGEERSHQQNQSLALRLQELAVVL